MKAAFMLHVGQFIFRAWTIAGTKRQENSFDYPLPSNKSPLIWKCNTNLLEYPLKTRWYSSLACINKDLVLSYIQSGVLRKD